MFAQHNKFGITLQVEKQFLNYHLKTPETVAKSAAAILAARAACLTSACSFAAAAILAARAAAADFATVSGVLR